MLIVLIAFALNKYLIITVQGSIMKNIIHFFILLLITPPLTPLVLSEPSFNGSTPGCSGSGCHSFSDGDVSATILNNFQVLVTVSGTSSKVGGELVDENGNVVAVINSTSTNPFILTAPSAGYFTLNAGYDNPSRRWDSTSIILSVDLMRKAPYLIYTGDVSEMQVLWQLISTATCTIDWGIDTTYSLGSVQTNEYGSDHQHTYTIENLTPATKYYYRIKHNQEVHTGSFRSAPDTNETDIKFFAYGDTRSNPGTHNQVAAAMVETYIEDEDFQSLIIVVGDLVNNGDSESDWDNQFFDPSYSNIQEMLATLPYQSCMGNHEDSGVLFTKYFPYPFVAGRYWSFDYGPAHFAVVDQYTSYAPGSAQLTWLENDLASTTKPWKFIYLHEPGWSAGGHSNEVPVQLYIQPLCEEYGIPIVFGGHNHYYARAEVNGVQHITTGGGGAPLYQPDLNYPNIITATMANHFCTIEIGDDLLSFKAIKPDGTVIDSFNSSGFNFPPVITSQPDTNAYVNTLYQYQVIAEDNNADTLTYRLITAPFWLSIDSTNGLIEGGPGVYSVGDTVVTARVDDGRGRSDTQTYTLHVHPTVGIDSESNEVPQEYALHQNYPNPFNPKTTLRYSVPQASNVVIKVFDILGDEIETLVNEEKPIGNYEVEFFANNLPSGIYFYKMQSGSFVRTKKMVLLR
jgi:hypothetical protein